MKALLTAATGKCPGLDVQGKAVDGLQRVLQRPSMSEALFCRQDVSDDGQGSQILPGLRNHDL
eukprot:scaffold101465_cov42-Prasinocladus_malaysianus.AAC.1